MEYHQFIVVYPSLRYHVMLITSFLLTPFISAPHVVIYDNGCNLHSYILNREPHFFEKTRFLVDRFHWPNHVGKIIHDDRNSSISHVCSFHVAVVPITYPSIHNSTNTQVVEQSNAVLKRAKSSLSYMNKEHFINHVKLILWYHNVQSR